MAKKYYSIPRGIVRESNKEIPQNFDLKKFWKRMANLFNVPFTDVCCDDSQTAPVRYNTLTTTEQYFDSSLDDWADIPAPTTVSGSNADFDSINTESITSDTNNIVVDKNTVQYRTASAHNTTATATADEIAGGLITSTSAAAVALTLPTATDLATQIGATQGTSVDFMVDNSAGSNTVTVTVNTGITAVSAVVTGSNTLTVASGAVGTFRIFFTSATVAKVARLI